MLLSLGCERESTTETDTQDQEGVAATAAAPSAPADRLHQAFASAIRAEPPDNALPPAQTITGKSVGKIYGEVENQWPTIRFRATDGKKLQYRATMETEFGTIELTFFPEIAPNHVRSFIALARAGFYDGLFFETRISNPPDEEKKNLVQGVLAGSPAGDGSELAGVGYWLLPEIAEKDPMRHEPGTVGAWRGYEPDTAGCRFYITLTDAPIMDGYYTTFARVTRGLDVVKKIFERLDPARVEPVSPPVIRRVTISAE